MIELFRSIFFQFRSIRKTRINKQTSFERSSKAKCSKFYALRLSLSLSVESLYCAILHNPVFCGTVNPRLHGEPCVRICTCMYANRFLVESRWFQLSFGREREASCYRARYFTLENLFRESLT